MGSQVLGDCGTCEGGWNWIMLHPMNHLVVTGGEGGLGQALVNGFDSPPWRVSAPGRNQLDVTDARSIETFFRTSPVDLLVCAAGIVRDAPLVRLGESDWDEVVGVNYRGAAACAAAVLPGMVARSAGHIVFMASFSAIRPPLGQVAYATAKAALLGLSEDLARHHGHQGIRVNVILPGFLETRMTAGVSARCKTQVLADHSLGRFNTPVAVARFIRFLHEELPHTSGQVFQLDSRVR